VAVRSYRELLSSEPAWPDLEAAIRASGRATVLPRDDDAARACLEALQVTTRSTLGAIAHETGGVLVDHGWLRMFGCGHPRLRRALVAWNAELEVPVSELLFVADDVVGGAFAINAGLLEGTPGNVFYFSPDTLAWEDTELGHTDFVQWALDGDLAQYYENLRWPGWEADVAALDGDHAFHLHPPPWTAEGADVSKVSRRAVPALEVWRLQQELGEKLEQN